MSRKDEQLKKRTLGLVSNPWYETPIPWGKLETMRRDLESANKQYRRNWNFIPIVQALLKHSETLEMMKLDLPMGSRDAYYWDFIQTKTESRRYADVIFAYRNATKILNPHRGGSRRGARLPVLNDIQKRDLLVANKMLQKAAQDLSKRAPPPSEVERQAVLKKYGLKRFGYEASHLTLYRKSEESYLPANCFARKRLNIAKDYLRSAKPS